MPALQEKAIGATMPIRRDIQDQDWFLNNSTQFVIILSSALGGICLICLYLLWRGPHRSKFPCFPSRRSSSEICTSPSLTQNNEKQSALRMKEWTDWSNARRASNPLLESMRSDSANRGGNIPIEGGGNTRKITKSPKIHGRTASKSAHSISTAQTISSFGHTPDQGPISYFGSPMIAEPLPMVEMETIGLVYSQPAATVDRFSNVPIILPPSPYSPPSAYPATPPTAYISSARRPPLDRMGSITSEQIPFPYPGLNSWSTPSLIPTSFLSPSSANTVSPNSSTASPSPPPMFNLFLPDTASTTSTSTPISLQSDILSPPPAETKVLDFSRPRPPSQLLHQVQKANHNDLQDRESDYSTISVYDQPGPNPISLDPASTPIYPLVQASETPIRPEPIKRKSALSQSYIPVDIPSSPFVPFPPAPQRQSKLSTSGSTESQNKVAVPIPQLARVKRGSYAASRMSMRSSKAPPSPLRQSVSSVRR